MNTPLGIRTSGHLKMWSKTIAFKAKFPLCSEYFIINMQTYSALSVTNVKQRISQGFVTR